MQVVSPQNGPELTDLYAYKRRGDWRLPDMISEPFPYFGNTTYQSN